MSFGCKKDKTCEEPPVINPPDPIYFPFTIGNYWIYDVYLVNDSTDIETQQNYSDTLRIIAEEVINGNTYFVIEEDRWLSNTNLKDTLYYRDSSGYIVNLEGEIIFEYVAFNTIVRTDSFASNMYVSEYSVSDATENITIPAGTFDCLNFKGRFNKTNPDDDEPDRFLNNCYAKDVGLIFQTIFFASNYETHYERRLLDYHLE